MARTVTGVDIGLRTAEFIRGTYKGNTFHVSAFAVLPLQSKEITDGWAGCQLAFKPTNARIGLTGRDVNIRYTRVPRVPDWQLRNLMRFEVEEIGDQSGAGVASDFNLLPQLPEIEGEDVVLLAMARDTLLEAHAEGLAKVGGQLDAFSPNAIALYNAFLRFGVVHDETVLIANIGHDNLDVVIARGPDLLFARNLTGGSRLFEDAIAQRFNVGAAKACELKETLVDLDPHARFTDPNAEKASRSALAGAGQLLSLLQSTVLFCKSQVKITGLKLDRVLICGGGAALKGLPKYLAAGLSVPVELFDPFRVVNVDALDAESKAQLEEYKLESVIALGLATMASDAEAWSIEILPASVRKKREFLGGQVFLIAAGVLALGYLGFHAWRTRSELVEARTRAASLDQQYKKASGTHRKTEDLLQENSKLAVTATELSNVKGAGEQLARTIDLLQRELPSTFWITQLSTEFRADPSLGVQRGSERPIVSVVGKAREGTNSLSTAYEGFILALENKLPKNVRMNQQLSPSGSKFTLDLTLFAPPADAPKEGDANGKTSGKPAEKAPSKPDAAKGR